jgi:hypothetical protein
MAVFDASVRGEENVEVILARRRWVTRAPPGKTG